MVLNKIKNVYERKAIAMIIKIINKSEKKYNKAVEKGKLSFMKDKGFRYKIMKFILSFNEIMSIEIDGKMYDKIPLELLKAMTNDELIEIKDNIVKALREYYNIKENKR